MELATIPYTVQIDYDGRKYQVAVPSLSVPRCAGCGTISLDEEADEQISAAFRRQMGLLSPTEIRRQRKALGLKQEELAEHLDVNVSTLSRWETGGQIQQRLSDNLMRLYFTFPVVRNFLAGSAGAPLAASFPPEVRELARKFRLLPGHAEPEPEETAADTLSQAEATNSAGI